MAVISQLSPYNIQSRLDSLVDDVLIHILSLLPVWDVLHLRQTSKRLEALSRVRAVWRALFERDVLTCHRPIPGLSFTPTPRLLQLCALDSSSESLDNPEFYDDKYDVTRELIEASDLEARTLHALRLDKSWNTSTTSIATSGLTPNVPNIKTSESHLRTFQTPSPVLDIFLFPGGRFVVSLHADRLRCWDLGVPHASSSGKLQDLPVTSVRCAGEAVFSHILSNAMMCMDTHPGASSVSVNGRHKEYSISFALTPDVVPSWHSDDPSSAKNEKRTCEILSVRLDPLRSSPLGSFDVHDAAPGSATGSPFATPVPLFLREAVVSLPELLLIPSYPEGSVSAQTMVGEQWGPQRFSRGKLGKLLLVYGSVMFFESFVPPEPVEGDEEGERGPKYVGIEVLDWNEPAKTVLFEYPDPQVGSYVGIHVHASADQVLVVWQNCAALYPLPFLNSDSSSVSLSRSLSGSASGSSSARSSRPSTPSHAPSTSKISSSLSPLLVTSPLNSSSGSSRSSLNGSVLDLRLDSEDVKIASDSDTNVFTEPEREPNRMVTMPNVIFALSEAVEAPIAFSLCDVDVNGIEFSRKEELGLPHPLTIVARSHANPNRNVQSVLTASPNPQASPASANAEDKFTFRLSRIPTSTENDSGVSSVAALAIGSSGRGVRADTNGALFRCTRSEVVLPRLGFGFGGFGFGFGFGDENAGMMQSSAVPTVDFWPWRSAAVLSPSSTIGEDREGQLALHFDDGMGRVVAVRVPHTRAGADDRTAGTSEVTVLDFA
ncbi:hypothetical protein ACEPAI_8717 [Sanghuangporus weigelae]